MRSWNEAALGQLVCVCVYIYIYTLCCSQYPLIHMVFRCPQQLVQSVSITSPSSVYQVFKFSWMSVMEMKNLLQETMEGAVRFAIVTSPPLTFAAPNMIPGLVENCPYQRRAAALFCCLIYYFCFSPEVSAMQADLSHHFITESL